MSVDLGLARWDGKKRIAEWLETIKTPRVRSFLTGVVYGPWTVMTIEEFREAVPDYYPLRHYPDLCHSASCQFPVDGWGWQLGGAHLREGINPRPLTFQRIFRDTASLTIGCGCYSEGMQDDVNKYIWLILHWGADNTGKGMNKKVPTRASEMPDKQLSNVLYKGLLDYVTLLMGQNRFAEEAVKCIYSLEKNWTYAWLNEENSGLSTRQGSAVTYSTAALALDLDGKCQPRHRLNWRFNLLLFRAFFDAHIVAKFEAEDMLERRAFALIRNANPDNVATTLTQLISLADEARFPAGGGSFCSAACLACWLAGSLAPLLCFSASLFPKWALTTTTKRPHAPPAIQPNRARSSSHPSQRSARGDVQGEAVSPRGPALLPGRLPELDCTWRAAPPARF